MAEGAATEADVTSHILRIRAGFRVSSLPIQFLRKQGTKLSLEGHFFSIDAV